MTATEIVLGVVALALLGVCGWLAVERSRAMRARDNASRERDDALRRLEDALGDGQRSRDAFKSLAGDVLREVKQDFLQLAEKTMEFEREKAAGDMERRRKAVDDLVKPIAETLKKTEEKLGAIEKERGAAYAGLTAQVVDMVAANRQLREETGKLGRALSKPQVRGRYGEIVLERIAELAGMKAYCDFTTQSTIDGADGARVRPDMIVRLPNDRRIVVDSKMNTDAYMAALDATSPEQVEEHLRTFARHVQAQVAALGKKEYWAGFDFSPEFVVMFVPGDQFVDAALEREPSLLDFAAERGVIIASPSTLIGLLRAVHVGWREKQLTDSAGELFKLGRELHERASIAFGHVSGVGKAIQDAMTRYNEFVGSVDMRLMPTLRRFEEAGAKSARDVPALDNVEVEMRRLNASTSTPAQGDAPADA